MIETWLAEMEEVDVEVKCVLLKVLVLQGSDERLAVAKACRLVCELKQPGDLQHVYIYVLINGLQRHSLQNLVRKHRPGSL